MAVRTGTQAFFSGRDSRIIYRLWSWSTSLWDRGGAYLILARILRDYIRKRYGCYLSPLAVLRGEVNFPHPTGIVIGDHVEVGSKVTIYQNVTVGQRGGAGQIDYPVIADGATIYAGAVVIGKIVIGELAVVGANSVVTKSVEPGQVVAGAPARILRKAV